VHNCTCWSTFLLSFMTLGQILFELLATQKRTDGQKDGHG
jgi:hypothetical protein